MTEKTEPIEEAGTDLAPVNETPPIHRPDVFGLMSVAADKGMGLEDLKELFGLQERIDARNARMAFSRALAAFRAECPQPQKTRENAQFSVTRDGQKRASRYAPLEEIDRVARPVAARHGLSWLWDTEIDGDYMRVTCKVFHEDGHMEAATVAMPYESKAGASPQQKYGSTQTYGMRYSLIAALGITTADDDVDGAALADPGDTITDEQAAVLREWIEVSGADEAAFLEYVGTDKVENLSTMRFDHALKALQAKARKAGAEK
jgi:hypothetical protein